MVCESIVADCAGVVFFFKQKTAYERRISDWSSDVCSSDLARKIMICCHAARAQCDRRATGRGVSHMQQSLDMPTADLRDQRRAQREHQIGRASCRERVCQYV